MIATSNPAKASAAARLGINKKLCFRTDLYLMTTMSVRMFPTSVNVTRNTVTVVWNMANGVKASPAVTL